MEIKRILLVEGEFETEETLTKNLQMIFPQVEIIPHTTCELLRWYYEVSSETDLIIMERRLALMCPAEGNLRLLDRLCQTFPEIKTWKNIHGGDIVERCLRRVVVRSPIIIYTTSEPDGSLPSSAHPNTVYCEKTEEGIGNLIEMIQLLYD